ncbi:serine O-acetyltransferase [Aeoliella mucimassa]|uniref:Serine acetyltransferase n=1 Tax=Aeoliella mucimassa TaxID=2527972 RepID=A0A518AQA1_9BACT|nr:serine acetyltransferase [Aeoliella mucimassa]QDU56899.1 Serine acetyltransferase [Aeoliella mucimassa]
MISATQPDWSRERVTKFWRPSQQLLRTVRGYQSTQQGGPVNWLLRKWYLLGHRFWSVVCGCDIPLNVNIAGGLLLPHPNGIVIHPQAVVGPNCLLFHQVTLGEGGSIPGFPKLGGHVDVGAGAKILGGVIVGDHARIGANAVVLEDVPAGATAVGIPARIVGVSDCPEESVACDAL